MAAPTAMKEQPPEPKKVVHGVPSGQAGEKVTVACKLPQGLVMQLHRPVDVPIPILGGGVRVVEEYHPDPDCAPITLKGWRGNDGKPAQGSLAGCGLTHNVPIDYWERWLSENADQAYIRNNLVFAFTRLDDVKGFAKEAKDIKSGLEPLNMARTMKTVDGITKSVAVDSRVARETPRVTTATDRDDE